MDTMKAIGLIRLTVRLTAFIIILSATGAAFVANAEAEVFTITAAAREGGAIDPAGSLGVSGGGSQTFTFTPEDGYAVSDVVIDGFSRGPMESYSFTNVMGDHSIVVVFAPGTEPYLRRASGDEQIFTADAPPSVMLVMSRDHKLYYKAYTDYSDLDGDGNMDTTYKHTIDYYGYFDSNKCYEYKYDNGAYLFEPTRVSTQCDQANEWSGNFLNWASMARIDTMRKALYGGYRSVDSDGVTVLERTFIPQDAHSWVKVYSADPETATQKPPINWLTPFSGVTAISICNTTLDSYNNPPIIRVAKGDWTRWASNERWQCACSDDGKSGFNELRPHSTNDLLGDFAVRVKVCVSGLLGSEKYRQYKNGNIKPIGFLQRFGEIDQLYFGLITGSYTKNKSGGVLRKNIGSITDEVDLDTGKFTNAPGIIKTLNSLKIARYCYSGCIESGAYNNSDLCPWGLGTTFTEGTCTNWGNPVGEMYYEALRYFAGFSTPTEAFAGDDSGIIAGLDPVSWIDPYDNIDYCSKPFIMVISDISPSFDSDQLPGSYFNAGFTGDLAESGLTDIKILTNNIGKNEELSGNYFVGRKGDVDDGLCTEKTVDEKLGEVNGLCPQEPDRTGSYYLAGLSHWARTHDLRQDLEDGGYKQTINTYSVALTSPLPEIKIPVGDSIVKVVPACKNITDANSAALVHFLVVSQTDVSGKFYMNWEDSEQGADYDMDTDGYLYYEVNGNQITFTVEVTYSSTYAKLLMGYIISGTTEDGVFLLADNDESTTGTKTHTVGVSAASLLKDPLWYAAKWGGFNDLDDNGMPNLQSEWDKDGNGVPDTYYLVTNPLELEQQLNRSFREIISRGVSHVAPVVSVDEANRTQSGDEVYMAFFRPLSNNYWLGNLKKYGLDIRTRTDCNRTEPEVTVVDMTDNTAVHCDGTFNPNSISYWVLPEDTEPNDGGLVDEGGVGEIMLSRQMPTDDQMANLSLTVDQYHGFRNIYTYKTDSNGEGLLTPFNRIQISSSDLGVVDDWIRDRVINFTYGYTFDSQEISGVSGYPVGKRDWILGDIIHSEPRIIDYFGLNGSHDYRFIVVGSNDGMLHVFTDREVTLNGHSYPAGAEILAFIPGDLLPRLEDRADPNSHIYLVDGSANLFRAASQINEGGVYDGYYHKTLVFGERRGGRSYWALDVSSPDPSAWKVKWHIQGGSVGITTPVTQRIEELGYTWSKPFFTTLKIGDGLFKDVVIFAGGYDPDKEDGFPEAFADTDDDGIRDPDEFHAPTVGGTEGYDLYNPGTDIMGRGIFVVDLADGTLLFKATFAGGGNEVTTGTDQRYGAMKYCFPAELSVIPFSETELVIYAADIYGQIWKVHYRYNSDQEHNYSDPNSEKWTVKRIFAANPGSDMPSGDAVWFGDETLPSLVSADAGRKTFYPPDISYFGNEWTSKPVLYFGTGDRAHPHYRMIKNRFYVVADYDQMTDETGLLNLTCGELSENADANGNGGSDEDDARLQTTLAELLQNGSARGFFRILSDQGNCIDDNTDHTGEQVLSQPTLFFKNVYFTSYQHVLGVPCSPTGNAYIYALDYSYGAPVFNYNILNDTDFKIYDLSDSYLKISGSSIPSGVRIITRGEEAAGLISAGRSASGVGEEQKTKIPGPPGGVSQLLWETGE